MADDTDIAILKFDLRQQKSRVAALEKDLTNAQSDIRTLWEVVEELQRANTEPDMSGFFEEEYVPGDPLH